MVTMTLICDRCGSVCKEGHNDKALYTLERQTGESIDLCETCNKLLNDFMNMEGDYE